MNLNSKIYLAGHTGLVGSTIFKKMKQEGYKNIITKDLNEVDLTRQDQVEKFFEQEQPEYVFLAAAKVGGILANDTYKAEFIYDNLMIAANVIHASFKYKVKKLLNLGSSCIYPKLAPQPLKEEYLLSDYLEQTNEPYAIAKITAIKLCRYYNEQYGTNFISVMPTNLYGPGDNFNLETSHVLPALLRKFHLSKLLQQNNFDLLKKDISKYSLGYKINKTLNLNNKIEIKEVLKSIGITRESVKIWGSGEPFREFLFVDDLADAVLFLMKNYNYPDIGEIINIGAGVDIKIKDLVALIKDVIGFEGEVEFDSSKPDGTPKKLLDVSRLKKLGWNFKTDLEFGIQKTYKWYLQSLDKQIIISNKNENRAVI